MSRAISSGTLPQFTMALVLFTGGMVPGKLGESLRGEVKGRLDLDRIELSYYEHLLNEGQRLDVIASTDAPPPPPFKDGPLALQVDDLRECVLVPSLVAEHQGATWTTNALGLRDLEYHPSKPDKTRRILLLGDSIGVGWGVDDGKGFEPLLEQSLAAGSKEVSIEILNLSVPGYAPGQRREHLERIGWDLDPDLILYQATAADLAWDERRLRALLPAGIAWDSPAYQPVLNQAGIRPDHDADTIKRRLRPLRGAILKGVYRTLVQDAQRRSVPVVWVLLPRVGRPLGSIERANLLAIAHKSGFSAVLDLSDTFAGLRSESLAIGPEDYHPNARGHALIAQRLEAALVSQPALQAFWADDSSLSFRKPTSNTLKGGRSDAE